MSKITFVLLTITLFCCTTGCDSQKQQDEFIDDASRTPTGYTRTEEGGNIVSEDTDDWRTAPIYRNVIRIDPAYPNPSHAGFVNIPVAVRLSGSVRGGLYLRAYGAAGRLVTLGVIQQAIDTGYYAFSFNVGLIGSTGLHRLFIFDSTGEMVSYGDLQID